MPEDSTALVQIQETIMQERGLRVPACHVVRFPDTFGARLRRSHKHFVCPPYVYADREPSALIQKSAGVAALEGRLLHFDEVCCERSGSTAHVGVIGSVDGRSLRIEVVSEQPIDYEDVRRIRAAGLPTIQLIVLPTEDRDEAAARRYVLERSTGKRWSFNPRAEAIAERDFARVQLGRQSSLRTGVQGGHECDGLPDDSRGGRLDQLDSDNPSPAVVLEWPVLFLDFDDVLKLDAPGGDDRLACLREALLDLRCSIVVTSASRYRLSSTELSQRLGPLGRRYLGATPVLDIADPYGNRANEISAWLDAHGQVGRFLVLDACRYGFRDNWHVIAPNPRMGLTDADVALIRKRIGEGVAAASCIALRAEVPFFAQTPR